MQKDEFNPDRLIKEGFLKPRKPVLEELVSFTDDNTPYVIARVKYRLYQLFTNDVYEKLLLMNNDLISAYLTEGPYRKEFEHFGLELKGANLIETAIVSNLVRNFKEVVGFAHGQLKAKLNLFLGFYDVRNLQVVFRRVFHQSKIEIATDALIPVGKFNLHFLKKLLEMDSIENVILSLDETIYFEPIFDFYSRNKNKINEMSFLNNLEFVLFSAYYENTLKFLIDSETVDSPWLDFLKTNIDIQNLKTLFSLFERPPVDKNIFERFLEINIKGGIFFEKKKLLNKLKEYANSTKIDLDSHELLKLKKVIIDLLRAESPPKPISAGLDIFEKTYDLSRMEITIRASNLKEFSKFYFLYPNSILSIIEFFIRKEIEIRNIRAIVRGKEKNISSDEIRGYLVLW